MKTFSEFEIDGNLIYKKNQNDKSCKIFYNLNAITHVVYMAEPTDINKDDYPRLYKWYVNHPYSIYFSKEGKIDMSEDDFKILKEKYL